MNANCNTSDLSTYVPSSEIPWNARRINHLFKRAAFGIKPSDIDQYSGRNPEVVIDELLDTALVAPLMPRPSWADDFEPENVFDGQPRKEWKRTYLQHMLRQGLRDRMSFFWSNHFVTAVNGYACSSYMYRYTKVLQENALGNFKSFIHDIGLESAMLIYLNGNQNNKNRPNENYARELYELFALGEGNGYTQTDIEETARALTGYNRRDSRCSPVYFVPENFDDGEKTIFGRTGNWGYSDVINILFEERGEHISKYIVQKLYSFLVHPELPENTVIIDDLAALFRTNSFEIAPVLRALLKSEHFFSEDAMDVIIKSPVDVFLGLYEEAQFVPPDDDFTDRLTNWTKALNQDILLPPNVAGWQRDKDWISSPTLIGRWNYLNRIVKEQFEQNEEQFRNLALSITGPSGNVEFVSRSIVDWFLPQGLLSEQDYLNALDAFKSDAVPENYYEDGTWDLNYIAVPKQVCLLMSHIVRQPEFQIK